MLTIAFDRKLEARLFELLETETEALKDLLEVERELARVRETIERFEGKLRLWDQQVALSTLTVELTTRVRFAATEPKTLGEQIRQTISSSWQALVNAGLAIVLVVVAMLPWILPILLLGWLALRLVRRIERGMARRAEQRRAAYLARAGEPSED